MADSSTVDVARPTGTASLDDEWWTDLEGRPGHAVAAHHNSKVVNEADAWLARVAVDEYVGRPYKLKRTENVQPRFRALQSWEGRVVEVFPGGFLARLYDLTSPGLEEEAEIDCDEITTDDLPLVVPGAIFYWSIGYRRDPSGSRSRSSEIRFRRLPQWSDGDVRAIDDRVAALKERTGIGG